MTTSYAGTTSTSSNPAGAERPLDFAGQQRTRSVFTTLVRHARILAQQTKFAGFAAVIVALLVSASAFAQVTATAISKTNTVPRGAIFLSDAGGGHWWISDAVSGICELTPSGTQPPFNLTSCNGTVKSGGQIVVGPIAPAIARTQPANSKFLYVADDSTTSTTVYRFVFNPAGNGSLGAVTAMDIPNQTSVGGGARGGRSVAVALTAHSGPAANAGTQDLYVGYLKSGDVIRVDGIDAIAQGTTSPVSALVGSTVDGRGVNSLLFFGNDLYLGETGGFGVSKISDPSGITRTACSAAAPCSGISLDANPSFLPGGMATDWVAGTTTATKSIFIADAPRGGVINRVLKYDPSTGVSSVYSSGFTPSYVAPDANQISRTWTTYSNPFALGFNPANGDLYVGDDPQATAATPTLNLGHFWKITRPAVVVPTVTSVTPATGSTLGGTVVTIAGTGFSTAAGATVINFGPFTTTAVSCASTTSCRATTTAGDGVVDVRVTVAGQTSAIVAGDKFTYVAPPTTAITVSSVVPNSGATTGGLTVTIQGNNLATYNAATGAVTALPVIHFGSSTATNVACKAATVPFTLPVLSTCTATSPAHAAGTVDVQASRGTVTSDPVVADQFTYGAPTATLYAWGITAPKGGAVWLPGALGGHWWSSDHAQGLCRQDVMSSSTAPYLVPGSTLHALNFSVCGDDVIGSAGQAVYDPRLTSDGITHYVYVPDNAVKSTAVWRLTFDPRTESMVPDPMDGITMATAMTPLADVRTLKPNGMSLGPDGNLYVSDLVEPNIRVITNPAGDPRTQTIQIVAQTGDGRGANGTTGFIGNLLYISGNRAAQFFDITQCPPVGNLPSPGLTGTPCGMASVPAPSGVFVAGVATDPAHNRVYLSSSAGGGPAAIYRYEAISDRYVAFPAGSVTPDAFGVVTCPACTVGTEAIGYVSGANLPATNSPNGVVCAALTCQRPWDTLNHPTTGLAVGAPVPTTFAFVFGLGVDPAGNLAITEDPTAGARSGRGSMWIVPFIN